MPKTYNEFADTIRTLANQGKDLKLQKLEVMVELLEDHKPLWEKVHASVADVLKAERWETVTYYTRYKRARTQLGSKVIEQVGPEVACLLIKYDAKDRRRLLDRVLSWIERQLIPPHYQLVSEYAKKILPPREKKLTKAQKDLNEVLRYVGTLQKLLKSKNVKYPPTPTL